MNPDEQLKADVATHPRSALIEVLADTMQAIEDDDGNGRHINYYRSLAYATVELLPGLFYDEDALCDEPGCGAHPPPREEQCYVHDYGTLLAGLDAADERYPLTPPHMLFARAAHAIRELRANLEHAKAALANDNEGVRLWMLDCSALADKHRVRAEQLQCDLDILSAVGRIYLHALDGDPENEM